MRRGFGQLIIDSVLKTWNAAFVVGALIVVFLPLDEKVRMRWVLFTVLLLLMAVLTFFVAAYSAWRGSKRLLPEVVWACKPERPFQDEIALCMLEPSELFSQGALVSFYHRGEGGYEQLIGAGEVPVIQEDGRIQAILIYAVPGQEDLISKLQEGKSGTLAGFKVKPEVQTAYFTITPRGDL